MEEFGATGLESDVDSRGGPVRTNSFRSLAGSLLTLTLLGSTVAYATVSAPTTPDDQSGRVQAGLTLTSLPSNVNPSLAMARQITGTPTALNHYLGKLTVCDPARKAKYATTPIPCYFGDTRATKTAVLFGDSSTFAWTTALNDQLKKVHVRLALFEFSGCPSPDVTSTPTYFSRSWRSCNTWHKALAKATAKLHPFVVMSSSAAYETSSADTAWIQGYVKAFNDLAPSRTTTRILLGTSPWFVQPVPACVAAHVTSLTNSTLHYTSGSQYGLALTRDVTIANLAGATLVPTVGWLCYQNACPVVIDNSMVYRDGDHIFESYATHIGRLVASELAKAGLH